MIEYNKEIKDTFLTNGYICFIDKEHPLASKKTKYVYLHRHIASLKIGRWLKSFEHVHHIDGNKLNNDQENILIVTPSEHGVLEAIIRGGTRNKNYCKQCGKKLINNVKKSKTGLCMTCFKKKSRKFDPTKEVLEELCEKYSNVAIGKMFNVSDKTVGKRKKQMGIK